MRASDEDRQRVIAVLQRHTAAGRLTLDEFSDRVGSVYAARTLPELASVTRDLPVDSSPESAAAPARNLIIAFVIAIVVLALLGILFSFR